MSESQPPRKRPSFVFPLFLVGLGFFLLLWNLDLLPVGTWENLATLWPVLLVVLGVDLVIRSISRTWPTQIIRFVFALALIGGAFALAASPAWLPDADFSVESPWTVRTRDIREPLDGVRSAAVRIDWDRQGGSLGPVKGSDDLIRAELSYRDALVYQLDRGPDHAEIVLDTRPARHVLPLIWIERHRDRRDLRWDVELTTEIPLRLELETGSRSVRANLVDHIVEELHLDSSSGSVDLTLPGKGGFEASLDAGSGRVTITVPEGLALRVELDSGAGSFSPAGDRFDLVSGGRRDDGVWQTSDYDESDNRASLVIDQGRGSITLR